MVERRRQLFHLSDDTLMIVPIDATGGLTIGTPRPFLVRPGIEGYDVDGETIIAAERPPDSGDIRQLQIVTNWFPQLLRLVPLLD